MPHTPREVELKLVFDPVDAARLERRLARAAQKDGRASQKLVSVYFDTPDLTLRRNGITLRVRRRGTRYTQTVKLANGAAGLFDRPEWEHVIAGPDPDLAAAKGTPLERRMRGRIAESLRPVFETRITRRLYQLTTDGTRIEAGLDRGEVDTGAKKVPLCELELELQAGSAKALFGAARDLAQAVPLRLSVDSKSDRGYALVPGAPLAPDQTVAVHLAPSLNTEQAFRTIGRACLKQLVASQPAMLAGDGEALHQMRIAVRRLRAAIATFADVVTDGERQRITAGLKWIIGKLSPARDLDVLFAEVLEPLRARDPEAPGLALLERDLEGRRARAYGVARRAVSSERFRTLAFDTAAWIEAGAWTRGGDLNRLRREEPAAVLAADQLGRRRRKLRKRGKRLRQLTPAKRHKLRIAGKKLRYAVEFFADLFPNKKQAKRRKTALQALKALQDALGALNDITMREKLVFGAALAGKRRSHGPQARERALAAGLIAGSQEAQEDALMAAAESAYADFAKVKPFWK